MGVVAAIREMMAKGFTMDQALMAAEIMEANSGVDAQAERRRAKDRERKRLRNSAESAESAEAYLPSPNGPPPQTPPPLNPPSCPDQARTAEANQAPPRQAQPEAGQGKVDYDEVHGWIAGLVGTHPVATNLDISPIVSLVRAGFSRERIEIGVRAAVAAAKQPIKSWKSFDGWVKNTSAEVQPIAKPIDLETQWRNKLTRYRDKGDWPGGWGDPPGHPCCTIPAAFIAKFDTHNKGERAA